MNRHRYLLAAVSWLAIRLHHVHATQCSIGPATCECQPGTMTCHRLTSFPTEFPTDVTEFIFENCTFDAIPELPYTEATKLIIQDSNFTILRDTLPFKNMGKLEYLRLADAKTLAEISPGDFTGLLNLHRLELESTSINTLQAAIFAQMPQLSNLDLSGNTLLSVDDEALDGVTLTDFKCAKCGLKSLPRAFRIQTSVQTLDLSNNTFHIISPDTFANLSNVISLNLQFCEITSFETRAMAGCDRLERLFLNDNKIVSMDVDLLKDSHATIQEVHISDNLLTALPEGLFPGERLGELTIFLRDNPWHCDCDLTWLTAVHQQPSENATCDEPGNYEGQNIFTVSAEIANECDKEPVKKTNLVWIILIPILTVLVIFLVYYGIKHYRKQKQRNQLQKRTTYAGVYQDPMDPAKQPLSEQNV